MGQKATPTSIRLQLTKNWHSRWFSKNKYAKFLASDLLIKKEIERKLGRSAAIDSIDIKRDIQETNIIINTAKPGIIIGRSGKGITQLQECLVKALKKYSKQIKEETDSLFNKIKVEILEVRNPDLSANLISQNIASQLEKRIAYRRAIKQTISRVMQKKALGIKVQVSGRLNGVEIARREKFIDGSIPLSTFRANIDYGYCNAYTTYGVIGVKVWIYKSGKLQNAFVVGELDKKLRYTT